LLCFYPDFFVNDKGFKSKYDATLTEKEEEIVKAWCWEKLDLQYQAPENPK
jgi:hypothetical protein